MLAVYIRPRDERDCAQVGEVAHQVQAASARRPAFGAYEVLCVKIKNCLHCTAMAMTRGSLLNTALALVLVHAEWAP